MAQQRARAGCFAEGVAMTQSVYEVSVEIALRNRGRSYSVMFTAHGATDAVESAVRYARSRIETERVLYAECEPGEDELFDLIDGPDDIRIGCVKVWPMHFGPINERGSPSSPRGLFDLFEWKADFPA